jgi:hypothetical protein
MGLENVNNSSANNLSTYDIQNAPTTSADNIFSGVTQKSTLELLDKLLNDSRNSTASVEEKLALAKCRYCLKRRSPVA